MWRDEGYLLEMLIAARDARTIAAQISEEEFRAEIRNQFALTKALELIGEAARKVSGQTRQAHPEIDWNAIVGLRNRIVHEYRTLDLDCIWKISHEEVPMLISQLEMLVPPDEG
jgi:uncharacterized protein with HEPN domain